MAPTDTLAALILQDDWSLVIKGHALVEGAVSYMLSSILDKRLRRVLSMLELGREGTGKLEIAKALAVLTKGERTFIRTLSQLRNALAHDVRYLAFTFEEHLKSLDKQQRKAFFDNVAFDMDGAERERWVEFSQANPKGALALAVTRIVIKAVTQGDVASLNQKMTEGLVNYAEAALDDNPVST